MSSERALSILGVVAISVLVISLVWLSAAFPVMNTPGILFMDLLDWPISGDRNELTRDERWLSGVGAGLMASMASLLLLVVIPEVRKRNTQVKRGAIVSLVVWFLIDSAGSVAAGVLSNVFFNTVFLAALVLPLLVVRTD